LKRNYGMNPAASLFLIPVSTIYSAVTRARLTAYRRGLLSVSKLAAPVVSVGNLTTGGTGKTPLVEWVCRTIDAVAYEGAPEGRKVCVLTRGYGRANPKTQVVVSNGVNLLASAQEAGDEPFLLASNLLGIAAVVSNPDRVAAGAWAIENLHSEVFVLDDAFQHLRLSRDLDIVTIDATNPWGGGRLLPYGRLREPLSGLARADCVVITRAEQVEDITSIKKALKQIVGEVPILSSRMLTKGLRSIHSDSTDAAALRAQPIGAFCGIGNPDSFFNHLRREGYQLAFTRAFPDHHQYDQSELDSLVVEATAKGAPSLVTTAKDATKLLPFNLGIPCCVLEIQVLIDEEERLVDLIRKAIFKSAGDRK
jgi:tetraacyldisaccharide 4'-kinase